MGRVYSNPSPVTLTHNNPSPVLVGRGDGRQVLDAATGARVIGIPRIGASSTPYKDIDCCSTHFLYAKLSTLKSKPRYRTTLPRRTPTPASTDCGLGFAWVRVTGLGLLYTRPTTLRLDEYMCKGEGRDISRLDNVGLQGQGNT